MRPPTLAILGASTRAAAQSACRAGCRPVAADLFGDQDLRSLARVTRVSHYPHGFRKWLPTVEVDGWMYTGALENYPALVDHLAGERTLWGNSAEVLRLVRSPATLAATCKQAGLLFPQTRHSMLGLPLDGSWLAKTYRGSSGSGVRELNMPECAKDSRVVFQQRLTGVPVALLFVGNGAAARLLGVCRQYVGLAWTGARQFQYCGSVGPWPLKGNRRAIVQKIGDAFAARCGLIGLFGVDAIFNGSGVWTLEVNPRYTASMEIVERTADVVVVAAHVAACQERRLPITTPACHGATAGKAILFARQRVRTSPEFVHWAVSASETRPWPLVADVPPVDSVIDAGRPVVTVFAGGRDVVEVERGLRQRAAEAETRLYASSLPNG